MDKKLNINYKLVDLAIRKSLKEMNFSTIDAFGISSLAFFSFMQFLAKDKVSQDRFEDFLASKGKEFEQKFISCSELLYQYNKIYTKNLGEIIDNQEESTQ